jgi:DNA-binding NtrC family response regulator
MKKILIIDDEAQIRNICWKLFDQAGLDVRRAADAREATNIIIREDVDLILLDLKMSRISGSFMFEIIKEYNPEQKVIVSSVYPIDKQREMVPRANDYFDKSEGPLKLLEKIVNVLILD